MSRARNVINIVNFVRQIDERTDIDLFQATVEEVRSVKAFGFPNTFLLQYDALIQPEYQRLFLENRDDSMELGIWLEVVAPLCEATGIPWESRLGFRWDWHVKPGFLMAYDQDQRRRLLDEVMEKFKQVFGYYPRTAGSWIIDSFSMDYLAEAYGMDAFAICRDQWGTDCYTLWGGYYNQAYYPCRKNMLIPAQTRAEQIPVPVFRMLGSDPIYQYDDGFTGGYNMADCQAVQTLEPVWPCGADPDWVDWYLKNNFQTPSLGFAYTQAGQENSFGWDRIGTPLRMQFEKIKALWDRGDAVVETLGATGQWFQSAYQETPATAVTFLEDWRSTENQSVWYDCKYYRANLYSDGNAVWFRDIHLFDENRTDRYLSEPCTVDDAVYDALPVMDGYRWSRDALRAGIYISGAVRIKETREATGGGLSVTAVCGEKAPVIVTMTEAGICLEGGPGLEVRILYSDESRQKSAISALDTTGIDYDYMGWQYRLELEAGRLSGTVIQSENGRIIMRMRSTENRKGE